MEPNETDRPKEIISQMDEGLPSIEKSDLSVKCKLCSVQFGLHPRHRITYEVVITHMEVMEWKISDMCREWLRVPQILTVAALHGNSSKLLLPMISLVEEFQVTKAKLHQTLHDSTDPMINNVAPKVKTNRKRQAAAAQEDCLGNTNRRAGPR